MKCIATKTTVRKMDTFSSINEMYHTLSPQGLSHGIVAVGSLSLLVLGYLYYGINAEVKKVNLELEDQKAELDDALKNVDELLLKSANSAETVEVEHLSSKVDGILEEMDRESIEEGKYQAWKGEGKATLNYEALPMYKGNTDVTVNILIVREKFGTHKSNQTWQNWNGKDDGSVTVRDFYVAGGGTWSFKKNEHGTSGTLSEKMINGWSSVIRVEISIDTPRVFNIPAEQNIHLTLSNLFSGYLGLSTKKDGAIQWQRVLVDSNVSSPIIDVLF